MRVARLAVWVLALQLGASPAMAAISLWPFKSAAERSLDQAQEARERQDYTLAAALLEEVGTMAGAPRARLLHERGLLVRDQGELEEASALLARAADTDPDSAARVDLAAVLADRGRWPEAVVVLRRAFEERSASLRVGTVTGDARFAKLTGFEPYDALLGEKREEQSGPLGKLLLRLEELEAAAREGRTMLERVTALTSIGARLMRAFAVNVLVFVLFGLLITFGVVQLGLMRPPWTVILGMLLAALVWHLGARIATAQLRTGLATIVPGLLVVAVPYLTLTGIKWLWRRRWRVVAPARPDPFGDEQLGRTLSLIDEVSRLGHLSLGVGEAERRAIAPALRTAETALRRRLEAEPDREVVVQEDESSEPAS